MIARRPSPAGLLLSVALGAAACTAPGGPDRITKAEFPGEGTIALPDAGTVDVGVIQAKLTCTPAQSSQLIKPRSTIVGASTAPSQQTYFTSDLYQLFDRVCGGCHVDNQLGNFVVSSNTFSSVVTQTVLDIIKSNDPAVFIPPAASGGIPVNQRTPSDPVVELASLLTTWIGQKSPPESFVLPAVGGAQKVTAGYAITPAMSATMTNIGTCVPPAQMVGTSTAAMDKLDAMFAKLTTIGALPTTLDQTDLTTLDSEALAQSAVVSYAPTYPLWTDDAQKMRYVRVPRGQSIVFDETTQQFQIPPNTRFYKTFLKQVVDAKGKTGYRKIETRLIVSRPDTNLPDGTATQNAIYGTYVWNDDETQATLLNDPLRDGEPFADRIFPYITDEQMAQPIIASNPKDLLDALDTAGITRHYAIPGALRCVQCHEGSPSQAFVLGFTPLQIARRASGAGGTYEPAMGDELTQLQRLIDYGVITGVTSPEDVLPLERSEGARLPRTPEELNAQAYMVGNCAHCHNPRGLPSIKQPALKDVLVFLPGPGANQGIFEFPFDVQSPIRKRDILQDIPINYITPSLYDLPRLEATSKYFCPDVPGGGCGYTDMPSPDGEDSPFPVVKFVLAPWRSLVYRNVDTAYDYFDDSAIFPHMPLNTPGYDCRVAQIMGDWMVSLPAKLKDPSSIEDAIPARGPDGNLTDWGPRANRDPQPYAEVKPGDPGYAQAVSDASARLEAYHGGYRYNFCPATYTADIVDPTIANEVASHIEVTSDVNPVYDPTDPTKIIMPLLTPIRPDYVSYDDTDPAGPWFPRRPDWENALVHPDVPTFVANEKKVNSLTDSDAEDLENVVDALQSVSFTDDVRSLLLTEVPYGLWDTTVPGCSFAGIPTVGSFTGASEPYWMTLAKPAASAPVYTESPGAAIFTTICFNCHGLEADSKGLLADEITDLTGGDARVADFRDGILGPVGMPGTNRDRVFGPDATTLGLTSDDLAARYMAWMALGGTTKHLPADVLTQVSQAPVFGQLRQNLSNEGTPDMLRLGLVLCEQIATSMDEVTSLPLGEFIGRGDWNWTAHTGLIDTTGDAEMWLRLCSLGNRPLVRVATSTLANGRVWTPMTTISDLSIDAHDLYWGTDDTGQDVYGQNPVMDHLGNIQTGITADNFLPLCVPKPSDPTQLALANQFFSTHPVRGNVIPYCPGGFIQASRKLQVIDNGPDSDWPDARKWAARGAINAARAVFLYLDQIERNPAARKPLYSQCNLLTPTP